MRAMTSSRALAAGMFAALLMSTPAWAAPALVSGQQTTSNSASASSLGPVSLAVTPTIGNVLVMVGGNATCALSNVTGGGVTTWQKATSSTTNDKIEIWYGVVDQATNGVTVTAGCTGGMRMNLTEWSGLSLTVDKVAAQAGTTSPASAGSITTTNASDLILFGAADAAANTIGNPTPGTWTAMTAITTPALQKSWYQIVAATGAYNPSSTDTGTVSWDAAIAALQGCPATVSDPGYVTANVTSGQVTIYWSTPNQVMIQRNTANTFNAPTTGTAYAVGAAVGASAGTSQYNGAAGSFTQTGLTNGTTYYYKVHTDCGRTYSAGVVLTLVPSTTSQWSYATTATTLAPPGIDDNNVVIWGGNDSKISGVNSSDGSIAFAPFTTGGAMQARPPIIPAAYSSTNPKVTVAYVTSQDGFVYAIDTTNDVQLWKSAVPGSSLLQGGAAVWLQALEARTICGASTDVVFVGTRDTVNRTTNAVYALNGGSTNVTSTGGGTCRSNGTNVVPGDYLWKFTGATGGNPSMDYISSTPYVDYANNVVWVTSRSGATINTQPSFWKLNVQNGTLANGTTACGSGATMSCWSLGDSDSSPMISGDGAWMYVGTNCVGASCATQAATLNAIQLSTGTVKTYNPGVSGSTGTGNIKGPYPLRLTSFGTTSTIARVNNNITTQNTSQTTCQVSLAMTAGNTAIVVITAPSNFFSTPSPVVKITNVTDSSNNLYSRRRSMGTTAGPTGVEIWSATIGTTGTITVTANFSASTVSTCSIAQYSGVGAIGSPANNFNTGSTNPTVSNTNAGVTTLDANNWVVAGFAVAGTSLATSLTGTLLQTTTITGLAMALTDNNIGAQGGTWTNAITYAKKAWGAAAVELRSVSADQILYTRDQTLHAVQFTGSTGQFNQLWYLSPGTNVATPVDDGAGRMWVGVGQGTIYQLDSWSGGDGVWYKNIAPAASTVTLGEPSFDGISNRLYIGGTDGRVYAINVPF